VNQFTLAARIEPGQFDAKTGVFSGVSIITEGVAKGHGMLIDGTTISQVLDAAQRFSNGVKVKADHWSGVAQIIGKLTGMQIDTSATPAKLRGDLTLLQSLSDRDYYAEILTTFADAIGLSISCMGSRETIDGLDYLRVSELLSVDLVDDPAANPDGLLSRRVDNPSERMPKTLTAALTAGDLDNQLTGLSAADSLTALRAAYVALSCDCKTKREGLESQVSTLTSERDTAKNELATAKQSVADLTSERDNLKTQLGTKDTEISTLKNERDTAKNELEALKPEHIQFRTQHEQLASKGLIAPLKKKGASADDPKANTLSRAEFDALDHVEREAFFAKGGKITTEVTA